MTLTLKITDLSDLANPFVVFKDRPVLADGTILLPEDIVLVPDGGFSRLNGLMHLLPWIKSPEQLVRRTIKLEVFHDNIEIVLQRYLNFGKLYPIEYSKVALLISHNLYQGQYA